MTTYKERLNKRHVYVLLQDTQVLGIYGNLRKLCDSVSDPNFPSYWTLTRRKDQRIDFGGYSIQKVKLQ